MFPFLLYIDPGSGNYLIQAIVAGVLGIAFFFKNIVLYIRHLFQRIFRKKSKWTNAKD
jgi:cell shape-determining protein MreD